jgi:hypothetical protein
MYSDVTPQTDAVFGDVTPQTEERNVVPQPNPEGMVCL